MKFLNKMMIPVTFLLLLVGCEFVLSPTGDTEFQCEISFTSEIEYLEVGQTLNLNTKVSFSDTERCESNITWKSNNPEIASVNSDGKMTGKKEGQANIELCSKKNPENCSSIMIDIVYFRITNTGFENSNKDYPSLFVFTKDGNHYKKIENALDPNNPTWSPDGSRIAFSGKNSSGYKNIFTTNSDGSSVKNLTPDISHADHPDWHPNGKEIVMQAKVDSHIEIYKLNIETGELTQLTFEDRQGGNAPYSPSFSENGEKIAYSSHKEGNWEIYVMNNDGSNKMNMTTTFDKQEDYPAWSPDGSYLIYNLDSKIYKLEKGGKGKKLVTSNAEHPTWTSDGKIMYTKSKGLHTINPDGSSENQLFNFEDTDIEICCFESDYRPK